MEVIILNKSQAEAIKGIYSGFAAIEPVICPDGTYVIPSDIKDDWKFDSIKPILDSYSSMQILENLPDVGVQCIKDRLYMYNPEIGNKSTGIVKCVQTHNRTIYPPEQTPALFSFFRENSDTLEWIENEYVYLGWKRMYQGIQYEVIQEHQTLITWTPINTIGVLWRSLAPATQDWIVGVAYKVGDIVIYQGKNYQCLQAHTSIATWNPVATLNILWKLI